MGKTDDYIENETEQARPATPLFHAYTGLSSEKAMELRLEIQEEIDFQARLKKENDLFSKIKKILQHRIDFYTPILEKMKQGDAVAIFLENCSQTALYSKESLDRKLQIQSNLYTHPLKEALVKDIEILTYLKNRLDQNIPYLLEVFFLEIDKYHHMDQKMASISMYQKFNGMAKDYSSLIKIMFPFLTEEFKVFLKFYEKLPVFDKNIAELSPKEISFNNASILNFIDRHCAKAKSLGDLTRSRIEAYQKTHHVELDTLYVNLLQVIDQIAPIQKKQKISIEKLNAIRGSKDTEATDITALSYWGEFRSQFSDVYQSIKQLEQINIFIDELQLSVPCKAASGGIPAVSLKPKKAYAQTEMEEGVPPVADFFLPKKDNKKVEHNVTTEFFERKKMQFHLWQFCIQERKRQREDRQKENLPILPVTLEQEPEMTLEVAKQLVQTVDTMDEDSLAIFNSFFKPDNSCKPHNISFDHIQKLIDQVGGTLEDPKGSHFRIKLPDFFSQPAQKSKTQGSSYKPHGRKGEKWVRDAHQFCKEAFINVGLTPFHIIKAKNLIASQVLKRK